MALGQGDRLEVHYEEVVLGVGQLLSQAGEEGGGIPQHPVEAGVVGGSGGRGGGRPG